ncbi:MAG: GNAT family protein [Elusimicrobiota bacterium]
MATVNAAKLEGRRLSLRPMIPEDAGALFAAVESSREILKRRLRWVGNISAESDETAFIQRASRESPIWGVFETRSDKFVGVSGLSPILPEDRSQLRFGVWIRTDRHDRGYASEVGKLVIDFAFRKLGCHRISARLDPANRSFRRVLKKLGFRYEGCLRDDQRLNGRWVDQECWGLLKSERKR